MSRNRDHACLLTATMALWLSGPVVCQAAEPARIESLTDVLSMKNGLANAATTHNQEEAQLGGPNSVGAQLELDNSNRAPLMPLAGIRRVLEPYREFKTNLRENAGFSYGVDYNALIQGASDSPGESFAAGGALRFYGSWKLMGRSSGNSGMLVYKVENRHRLGSDIPPQALGPEVGYVGITATTFSDAGWQLSNLFWQQELISKRLSLVAGIVDTTDYVDVYGLVNPWADFINTAFGTNPTIPAPGQGLGLSVGGTLTSNLYVVAGLADGNGNPTRPQDAFDTFFSEQEYFKHVEIGWITSMERRYENNMHLTAWQTDARAEAGVPSGWGLAFSANHLFANRWLPFVRFGFSDGGGGAPLEASGSIGSGYYFRDKNDLLGIGLNWGKPSGTTYGDDLQDQYTCELFYRLQLLERLAITPDIQIIKNPALDPDEDMVTLFGLRMRLVF